MIKNYCHAIIIPIIFFICFVSAFSQSPYNRISSITLEGNKRTKTCYLLHFVDTKEGDTIDSIRLEEDLRILRSLPSVMSAKYVIYSSDTAANLVFVIKERITILPVGDFGITEDDFWLGLGAMESNMAGKGIYAYGFYRYGKAHTLHLIFRNPYVLSKNIGLETQFRHLPIIENSQTDIERTDFMDISVSANYEHKLERNFKLGLSYRQQENYYPEIEDTVSFKRQSAVLFSSLDMEHLNHVDFYIDGWENIFYADGIFPFNRDKEIVCTFYNELSLYKRILLKGNIALRLFGGFSTESIHEFSPFIADNYYNFRGIGYRENKGNRLIVANLEYRQTLIENKTGGIQAVVFSDIGSLKNSSYYFSGLGCRFILKKAYNAILRIDYGIDISDPTTGGWVIGLGQYF